MKDNLFTLFNFLNFAIAALLFTVGAYSNMLFLAIILLNIVIGIAQEFKAKKLVDELSILNRPTVCVRRDGKDIRVGLEEVIRGDLTVLESGSQICSDAVVVSGALEVNESLLTGESDAVVKEKGRRAVVVGFSGQLWTDAERLPAGIVPWYSIVLEDTIRPNAEKTLKFFRREGMDVKVISGDHIKTVSMIAKRAGLERWMDGVDMSLQGETPDYDMLCRKYSVFARVTPG